MGGSGQRMGGSGQRMHFVGKKRIFVGKEKCIISQLTLAEFAINNAASTLGDDLMPFFIDQGAHPRLSLSRPHDDRAFSESPTQYAQRVFPGDGSTVRELLASGIAAAQSERRRSWIRAESTRCSRSATGYCSKPPTLVSCARRWDTLFIVTACSGPNAYTLVLPWKIRCSPTVKVDRLKPFVTRAGTSPAPGPVSDTGLEGKHEVSCCSTSNWCVACCVTRCDGGAAHQRTTLGCGWMSWRTARRRWRNTTPLHRVAARPAASPAQAAPAPCWCLHHRPPTRCSVMQRRVVPAPPPPDGQGSESRWHALGFGSHTNSWFV